MFLTATDAYESSAGADTLQFNVRQLNVSCQLQVIHEEERARQDRMCLKAPRYQHIYVKHIQCCDVAGHTSVNVNMNSGT